MPDEPWADQLARVRLMAAGDEQWDLSPNDQAALAAVLERLSRLEEQVENLADDREAEGEEIGEALAGTPEAGLDELQGVRAARCILRLRSESPARLRGALEGLTAALEAGEDVWERDGDGYPDGPDGGAPTTRARGAGGAGGGGVVTRPGDLVTWNGRPGVVTSRHHPAGEKTRWAVDLRLYRTRTAPETAVSVWEAEVTLLAIAFAAPAGEK